MLSLNVTSAEAVAAIKAAPSILKSAADYSQSVAKIAPDTVRALNAIAPLLPLGPGLAPLVAHFNASAAKILQAAPSYAPTLSKAAEVMGKAPALAASIASATGAIADVTTDLGNDPDLAPFLARLLLIIDLASGNSDASSPAVPQAQATPGVGLKKAIPWLDRGIAVLRHKWLIVVIPSAVLLGVGGIGYAIGRGRRG